LQKFYNLLILFTCLKRFESTSETLSDDPGGGEEPEVIQHLERPPSRKTLVDLMKRMGIDPCELLRQKDIPCTDLKLGNPKSTEDQLIEFVMKRPIFIDQQLVVTPLRAKLCWPWETVLDILPNLDTGTTPKKMARWCRQGRKRNDENRRGRPNQRHP
jgi:arsenate reductase